jgi:hypothetical protein
MPLLAQIADQARTSEDTAFAVRVQSQAATLMWPMDRERARAVFRRAFQTTSKPDDSAERRQLRAELLNQIANRDTELAEEIARTLADSPDLSKEPLSRAEAAASEAERRELMISVALQIVEREPYRAMALGQLSLALGISPQLARLLVLMRTVERGLADLLFSGAVARLERTQAADLADLHTLGSYLVSAINSSSKDAIAKPVVVRFLGLAYRRIIGRRAAEPGERNAKQDEGAAAYFVGRQLSDLFARYMPERRAELDRRIAEVGGVGAADREIDLSGIQSRPPSETAREARLATDDRERDALYARAAFEWLAKGEVNEAQGAASKISDSQMRDRLLAQIARRQSIEGQIEDAVAVAQRIEDDAARVGVLIRLAGAALAARDRARATELLNEAEREAARSEPSLQRVEALLTVVSRFASFDAVRAFEVMQTAVKSLNGIVAPRQKSHLLAGDQTASSPSSDELYRLDFEGTLSVLARVDFDRALLMAEQLADREASLVAQLAVCRGGMGRATKGQAADDAGPEASP